MVGIKTAGLLRAPRPLEGGGGRGEVAALASIARELGFAGPKPTWMCMIANAALLGVKRKKESKAMRYVAGRYVAGHYAMLRAAVEGGSVGTRRAAVPPHCRSTGTAQSVEGGCSW